MKQKGDFFWNEAERKPMEQFKRAVFEETFRSTYLLPMGLWKVLAWDQAAVEVMLSGRNTEDIQAVFLDCVVYPLFLLVGRWFSVIDIYK